MRLFRSNLLILLSLVALATTVSACGDDDPKPKDEVNCEETPEAEECQTAEVDCNETPDAEECQVDCEETPDAEGCENAQTDCDADALKTAVLEQLHIYDTPAADIPEEVEVEAVSMIGTQRVSNYRVLTFTLPSSGQPGADTPDGSKLYLDIDNNAFLAISDEDALTNNDWDIAFDGKQLNYVYANSGHSGGFLSAWPAGLMLAELEDSETELDFIAIDATDTRAIPFAAETWVDEETCEADLTNWLPVLQPQRVLPKTTIGAWYTYDMDGGHQMIANPTGYAIYNSMNRHHVYKIKFLSYDARTLEVKLAVQDQFQQNACTEEIETVEDVVGVSSTAIAEAALPLVDTTQMPDIIIPGDGEDDDKALAYRKLSFALPETVDPDASKLYFSIQNNEFLSISDEEALGLLEDGEGNPIHNENWDIAIDLNNNNHVYIRSGQSGGYPHLDKYAPWAQRGLMATRKDDVADEAAFTAWDSGANTRAFAFEDFIDVDSDECTVATDTDEQPATFIGGDLFDVDNNAAFAIYAGGPCHRVFQFKVLSHDEDTDEFELGVIVANPGIPGPACQ